MAYLSELYSPGHAPLECAGMELKPGPCWMGTLKLVLAEEVEIFVHPASLLELVAWELHSICPVSICRWS